MVPFSVLAARRERTMIVTLPSLVCRLLTGSGDSRCGCVSLVRMTFQTFGWREKSLKESIAGDDARM